MEHCYSRPLYRRTDLSSFLAAFPLERCSLLFFTRLHRRLWDTNRCGLVWLRIFQNILNKSAVIVTWCRRTRIIQVGGTTRAAWAPIGQGSSICCSMKQDILLWYWKEKSSTRRSLDEIFYKVFYVRWNDVVWNFSKDTHSLFAPGTTNGHNLFTVKGKLLLKALHR